MSDKAPELNGELEVFLAEVGSLAKALRVEEPAGGNEALEILGRFGPRTVPQIARMRGTSRQNIQIVVNRLDREGHVELRPNPAHKRSDLVLLTEKGRAAAEEVLSSRNGVRELLRAKISGSQVTAATELLRQARELLAEQSDANPRHPIPSSKKAPTSKFQELKEHWKPPQHPTPRRKQKNDDKTKVASIASEPEEEGFPINLL